LSHPGPFVKIAARFNVQAKFLLIGLVVLSLALVSAMPVFAGWTAGTTITVSTFDDELNTDGDCSLREALQAANLDTGVDACPTGSGLDDTVLLPPGQYTLTLSGGNEDGGVTGDLDILQTVRLTGSGMESTILDGAGLDRVIHIAGTGNMVIENLTIQNGYASGSLYGGGGIFNQKGNLTLSRVWLKGNLTTHIGGGLDNIKTAILVNSMVSGNQADKGGGVFNAGMLTLQNVVLYSNYATQTGGGLDNSSYATLTNVTVSGNGAANGGGIFNDEELTLEYTTIYLNTTAISNATNVRFRNTLVGGSTSGVNCIGAGTLVSEGQNLEDRSDCNFIHLTDQVNLDPMLGPLDKNEAEILTHALLAGSPAIDRGDNLDCPAADQRGARRPSDGDGDSAAVCDIGAFEFGGSLPMRIYMPQLSRP
jgi:CSLREA domain-containing protein